MSRMKKLTAKIIFFLTPNNEMSYSYKFTRVVQNLKYGLTKKLSSNDIIERNRGDKNNTLTDTLVENQFPILQKYYDFIDQKITLGDKDKSILDIGCREGYLLELFSKNSYLNLRGVEIVPEWVSSAQKSGRTYVHQGDILTQKNTETYDVVVSRHTLEHVDQTALFFNKIVRSLNSGGSFVCVFPLNPKPNFKHPSYLPSVEWVKENFDFSELSSVKVDRLDEFTHNGEVIDLLDEREENEIIIFGQK